MSLKQGVIINIEDLNPNQVEGIVAELSNAGCAQIKPSYTPSSFKGFYLCWSEDNLIEQGNLQEHIDCLSDEGISPFEISAKEVLNEEV